MRRSLAAGLAMLALGACSDDAPARGGDGAADPARLTSQIEDGALVIDVRTPREFAAGHVADALNIDVTSGHFDARVRRLDRDAVYVVYCHTGRRAAEAIATMSDLGFTKLVDGGAYDDLVADGVSSE